MTKRRLLILGGTSDAAALATRAVERYGDRLDVVSSLAGRLRPRRDLPGRVRIGGFGGIDGLSAYLRDAAVAVVVDATHPFAAAISHNAAAACKARGIPRLMLIRPPWQPQAGDRWLEAATLADAAAMLPRVGRRAFLTVGPGSLVAFTATRDVWFLVRLFEPPTAPLPLTDHDLVVARPPFTVDSEMALFRYHRIDTLVSKQSGGPTEAKLTAARDTGARVIMIGRPPAPPGERVETVTDALTWLADRIG